MDDKAEFLEQLWSDLLSRQPELIEAAFIKLDEGSQKSVLVHLKHMIDDPGWQPEQRESARVALQTLENHS